MQGGEVPSADQIRSRRRAAVDNAHEMEGGEEAGRLTATGRSLAIIDEVLGAGVPLSAKVIGDRLALPRATTYRLIAALEDRGLLGRDPLTGGLTAGVGLDAMAFRILRHSVQRGPRHAILSDLVASIGETCNFGVLDDGQARYVDRVEAAQAPLRLDFRPGSCVPLYCSAMGKVFLAHMPEPTQGRYLGAFGFVRYTQHTIRDRGHLRRELDRVREAASATDDEEYVAGVNCLAVPVTCGPAVVAAIAIQAPKARSDIAKLKSFLPQLRGAATRLAATLVDAVEAGAEQPRPWLGTGLLDAEDSVRRTEASAMNVGTA